MKKILLITLIIFLAVFLRSYKLADVPPSLNWDETSVLWNAYSMVQTGSDEYGNSFPVSVRSFEDFKPPILTYAAAVSILLFGPSEFAVRAPSAVASVTTLAVLYLLILELGIIGRKDFSKFALLSILFLTLSPWHQVFSRIAFEASLGLLFFTLAVYLLVKFLQTNRSYLFFISLLFFVFGFYTHHSIRIVFPLFLSAIVLLNFRFFWKHLKLLIAGAVFIILLLSPLIYSNFKYSSLNARFGQTSIFYSPGLKDISRLTVESESQYLTADNESNNYIGKVAHNKMLVYTKLFLKNYLDHYNFDFLFLSGDKNQRHSIPNMGMLLILEFPLILAGIYSLIVNKKHWSKIIFLWFLVAPVASALTTETPHASRSFLLIPVYQILIAIGLLTIFKLFKSKFRIATALFISLLFTVNVFYFLHQYFVHLPIESSATWQFGYKQAVVWINENGEKYDKIYITRFYDQPYIYFLLYGGFSPALKNDGTFSEGFDKYSFVNFDTVPKTEFDKISQKTLLVLAPSEFREETRTLAEINFPNGEVAFRIAIRI